MSEMTTDLSKRVYNDEDGTRTLGFYQGEDAQPIIKFNLNVLEDMRVELGDIQTARYIAIAIGEVIDRQLTPAEIEWAVEDL